MKRGILSIMGLAALATMCMSSTFVAAAPHDPFPPSPDFGKISVTQHDGFGSGRQPIKDDAKVACGFGDCRGDMLPGRDVWDFDKARASKLDVMARGSDSHLLGGSGTIDKGAACAACHSGTVSALPTDPLGGKVAAHDGIIIGNGAVAFGGEQIVLGKLAVVKETGVGPATNVRI